MHTVTSEIDKYLTNFGWHSGEGRQWKHETSHGIARLTPFPGGGNWQHFSLAGGAVDDPAFDRILVANDDLYGPAKFVPGYKNPYCRVDLPVEFDALARDCRVGLDDMASHDPRQAWAAAVTALATGDMAGLGTPHVPETAVFALREAGWSADQQDGQIDVHIHMPGLFRTIRTEPQDPPGLKVTTDLICLDGIGKSHEEAICRFAQVANERLPLARLAVDENTEPRNLRAEVHLGCASILSGWLTAALEVVELAISLTARELQALQDRELAKLVLATDVARPWTR
jgi:hypothetical protein